MCKKHSGYRAIRKAKERCEECVVVWQVKVEHYEMGIIKANKRQLSTTHSHSLVIHGNWSLVHGCFQWLVVLWRL